MGKSDTIVSMRGKPQKESANIAEKTLLKGDSERVFQCLAVQRSQGQQIPNLVSHYSSSPLSVNWLGMGSHCPGL